MNALRERIDRRRVGCLLGDDEELVGAEARHGVRRSCRDEEAVSDGLQHDIPGGVTDGVVDGFEAVNVEEQDRRRGASASAAVQRMPHAVHCE